MALTEKERKLIPDIVEGAIQLSPDKQEKLFWLIQGMLFAGGNYEPRTSNKSA